MAGLTINMLLFCPSCDHQHIDAPDERQGWTNPPHRSHLCASCGHIWRPADCPTNGVSKLATRGGADSPTVAPGSRLRTVLEAAYNGLRWYREAYPDADSGADDEMYADIEQALTPTRE